MSKFTPTQSDYPDDFAGFWKPGDAGGAIVKGHITKVIEGEYGKTLIVRLTAPCEVMSKVDDEEVAIEAEAGESIGINEKAKLKGLDKYVGHTVTIKHLGKKTGEKRGKRPPPQTHHFDVDIVSPKPLTDEEVTKLFGKSKSAA